MEIVWYISLYYDGRLEQLHYPIALGAPACGGVWGFQIHLIKQTRRWKEDLYMNWSHVIDEGWGLKHLLLRWVYLSLHIQKQNNKVLRWSSYDDWRLQHAEEYGYWFIWEPIQRANPHSPIPESDCISVSSLYLFSAGGSSWLPSCFCFPWIPLKGCLLFWLLGSWTLESLLCWGTMSLTPSLICGSYSFGYNLVIIIFLLTFCCAWLMLLFWDNFL